MFYWMAFYIGTFPLHVSLPHPFPVSSSLLFSSLKETVDAIGIKGLLAVPIWAGLVALPLAMTVGGMVRVEAVKCHIYIYFWSRKCDFTRSLPSTYLLSSLRLTLVYAFIMCGIAGGNFPGRMEAECLGSSRVVRFNLLAVCKYEELYYNNPSNNQEHTSKKEERKRLLVGYVLHITHICHQRLQSPSPQSQPLNRLLFRSSWFYCVILNVFPFCQNLFSFVSFLPFSLSLPSWYTSAPTAGPNNIHGFTENRPGPLGLCLGLAAVAVGKVFLLAYHFLHLSGYFGKITPIQSKGAPDYNYLEGVRTHRAGPIFFAAPALPIVAIMLGTCAL